jgi:hypothetical protein
MYSCFVMLWLPHILDIMWISYSLSKWRFSCLLSGNKGPPNHVDDWHRILSIFYAHNWISFEYISFWYLFLDPHLTTYHSIIDVQVIAMLKLHTSTLATTLKRRQSFNWMPPHKLISFLWNDPPPYNSIWLLVLYFACDAQSFSNVRDFDQSMVGQCPGRSLGITGRHPSGFSLMNWGKFHRFL